MLVRARDDIYNMQDLRGKKIGLSKSLNTIKNDFDVHKWAAPEFFAQAARELLEDEVDTRKRERLSMDSGKMRIG